MSYEVTVELPMVTTFDNVGARPVDRPGAPCSFFTRCPQPTRPQETTRCPQPINRPFPGLSGTGCSTGYHAQNGALMAGDENFPIEDGGGRVTPDPPPVRRVRGESLLTTCRPRSRSSVHCCCRVTRSAPWVRRGSSRGLLQPRATNTSSTRFDRCIRPRGRSTSSRSPTNSARTRCSTRSVASST